MIFACALSPVAVMELAAAPRGEICVEHVSTTIAMLPVELAHAARKIAGMLAVDAE